MTLSGSMAAEKAGVPAIALMPTYATNEHFSFRALLPVAPPPEMKEMWTTAARLVAEFAAGQGVKTPRIFDGPPAPFNIVFIPREFQPMGETFDERFQFVGPCVDRRESDPTWTHEGPRPLLFISLGTTPLNRRPDFFRLCLDAFGHSQWDVAMAIGEQTEPGSLGPIPVSVQIRLFFPQLQVLRQADVFLTHAGNELDDGSSLFRRPAGGRPAAAREGGHGPPAGGTWPGPPAGSRRCDCAGPFAHCCRGQRQ
jgi:MGT family glycosyltransferase